MIDSPSTPVAPFIRLDIPQSAYVAYLDSFKPKPLESISEASR